MLSSLLLFRPLPLVSSRLTARHVGSRLISRTFSASSAVDSPSSPSTSLSSSASSSSREKDPYAIHSENDLDAVLERVEQAHRHFSSFSQAQVDHIFHEVALATSKARVSLAKLAVADTGRGIVEDKVIKNQFASEMVYNKYKGLKTVGVVESDVTSGFTKIAEPVGPIVAFAPVTNPTSTLIFKALIALKTRNAIVFSPHPSASECSNETARIVIDAALRAGAPEYCVSYLAKPTSALSNQLLHHPKIKYALATGGPGVVNACYSSGKPAIGVGAGNAPALVDETADLDMACASIVLSKTFDNGMICATEQAVVVVDAVYDQFLHKLQSRGVHVLSPEHAKKVGDVLVKDNLAVNPAIVGQSPRRIAELAGVPFIEGSLALAAEVSAIGSEEKWSFEKLSPTMAIYRASDFADAVHKCEALAYNGGAGHTATIFTNPANRDRLEQFEEAMPVYHMLVNSPATFGAIGDVYNFQIEPSLTLGCGTAGGNSVSKNVGPMELLNFKYIAEKRENMQWIKVPPSIYFKRGIVGEALKDLRENSDRIFIVTDRTMEEMGIVDEVTKHLPFAKWHVHSDIAPEPTFSCLRKGVATMDAFKPDTVIALGGGSPLDAAKVMRLMYEHPEVKVQDMYARFLDIRKRICQFPRAGTLIKKVVCIPTTSGTGAEMTPFAVITGDDGHKYPIADYMLTPDMAIVDPQLAAGMPKTLTAYTGYDVLTHAVESHVSVMATDYTMALSARATLLVHKHLKAAVDSPDSLEAREGMHNASAIAGVAFANAFLGISHSLAHAIGGRFHIAHGLANALVLSHVCLYNASTHPTKMAAFPQYKSPHAKNQYAELADHLGLTETSASDDEKLFAFINRLEELKQECGIPLSIREAGVGEAEFEAAISELAEQAFDDQCTSANPRYPLMSELEQILRDAYNGPPVMSS